jgi:hypothetical protein
MARTSMAIGKARTVLLAIAAASLLGLLVAGSARPDG